MQTHSLVESIMLWMGSVPGPGQELRPTGHPVAGDASAGVSSTKSPGP